MSFLKRLASLLSPAPPQAPTYWIYARCNRCEEPLRARVNLNNDLSVEYDGDRTTYYCRKVLLGEKLCFQQVEVHLTFDSNRKLLDGQISGGRFISEEEYQASPPESQDPATG
jgi:hypothetical protein